MESWREEGLLYIKQEYCKYGDLLDFLQSLEKKNFQFDIDFYWDIFFEMICVNQNKLLNSIICFIFKKNKI